jgi:hypothetical protein
MVSRTVSRSAIPLRDTPGRVRPVDQTLALDGQAVVAANGEQALAADELGERRLTKPALVQGA